MLPCRVRGGQISFRELNGGKRMRRTTAAEERGTRLNGLGEDGDGEETVEFYCAPWGLPSLYFGWGEYRGHHAAGRVRWFLIRVRVGRGDGLRGAAGWAYGFCFDSQRRVINQHFARVRALSHSGK